VTVRHSDRAAGPAGAQELVGNLLMIRREDRSERRRDDVELLISEVQSLRIRRDPLELDPASGGFTPPGLEELGFA
jgi:hypothetical protein